jgi:hypothetical protein
MDQQSALINNSLKTPRAAAIAGIVFAVLSGLSYLLIWKSIPAGVFGPIDQAVTNVKTLSTAFNLAPFAGIAFLWFVAVIRDQIGEFEDRFFATVVLGSGLLYVAMFFVSAALAGGLLRVLGDAGADIANTAGFAVAKAQVYQISNVYAIKVAGVFMLSTSTVALRTRFLPRWMTYVGYLLAAFLLLAMGSIHWTPIVFPLWVLVMSCCILGQKYHTPKH